MPLDRLDAAIRRLEVGDIVLTGRRGWAGRLVRFFTRSRWAHVTMVFECVPRGDGSQDVLLVEAVDESVQVHRIEKYARGIEGHIGIKRVPGLSAAERERIRGFFLDALDAPYDKTRLLAFFVGSSIARFLHRAFPTALFSPFIDYEKYVCSSLVQRAYYLGVAAEKRERILFQPIKPTLKHQLEFITPADIAHSANAAWLYKPSR